MAIRSDITPATGWWWGERKILIFTVLNDAVPAVAVNLTTTGMVWRVSRYQSAAVEYLEKTTPVEITVSGAGSNLVSVTIEIADYLTLPAGKHYHELWDVDNSKLLSFGDAFLHVSRGTV